MIVEYFMITRCWECRESDRSESRMTPVKFILSSRQQSTFVTGNTAWRMKIQTNLALDSESLRALMPGGISPRRSWATSTTGEFLQPTPGEDQYRIWTLRREILRLLFEN